MAILKIVLYGWLSLSVVALFWFLYEIPRAMDIEDMDNDNEAI